MDKYYIPPVGNSINPTTGTQMYVSQEDYDKNVHNTQALYQWFCNWLNGMDFENMSEMDKAREILLHDFLTFGVIMVKANDADGMVAGACHATADTLRPALQILKTAPGVKLVSGFFLHGKL